MTGNPDTVPSHATTIAQRQSSIREVSIRNVSVVFSGKVRALDDVSLVLARGDVLGLVGESGSGKTTLCRVIVGLQTATAGSVQFDGQAPDLSRRPVELAFRRRVQMLLQDAGASLSPRMRIRDLVEEPLRIHGLAREEGQERLERLMQRLGLPAGSLSKYPHQISGGQARRVAILRALMLQPDIIVADEPTAGLDVSVQGELLNLMLDLRAAFDLTYLIVSHNLNVVRRVTTRTAVMYLGQIIEEGPTSGVFATPAHPYTDALLSTNPAVDLARRRQRVVLHGEIPSPAAPPSGCRFHTRCPQVQERCRVDMPALREDGHGRRVRCHFPLAGQWS